MAMLSVRLARKSPLADDGGDEMLIENKAVGGSLKLSRRLAAKAKLPPVRWFKPIEALKPSFDSTENSE